jgi:uncharacterized membrane protein YdjX (TVP38/TMEM64 family)
MKVFSSRENRWRALLGLLGVTLGFVVLYLAVQRYASFVFEAEELRVWIGQFGPFAPAVFVAVQFLQVILAPIPGQVVALVAGYLFGPVAGTVYSMVGVVAGSAVAFSISKVYGRSAVERLIDERLLAQFDGFVEEVGAVGLLVFVAIPGLPDDAVCFLAGLTTFRLRTFLVLIGIGRLPAYVLTVYAGGSLAAGRLIEAVIALAAIVAFLVVGYLKRDAIKRHIADR